MFDSLVFCLDFVETYGFSDARISLLKRQKHLVQAITGLLDLGRAPKAVELYNVVRSELKDEERLSILRSVLQISQRALFLNIATSSGPTERREIPTQVATLAALIQTNDMSQHLRGTETLEVRVLTCSEWFDSDISLSSSVKCSCS